MPLTVPTVSLPVPSVSVEFYGTPTGDVVWMVDPSYVSSSTDAEFAADLATLTGVLQRLFPGNLAYRLAYEANGSTTTTWTILAGGQPG